MDRSKHTVTPNRRAEERNAWIEYLATESDDSILGPEEVDIHE